MSTIQKEHHPLHYIWDGMISRCCWDKNPAYKNYGGRGISVCDRWMEFDNFVGDLLPSYKKGLSLDRINNDGNYEPSNCRWADRYTQNNNSRKNTKITLFGITKNIGQWCDELKLKRTTVMMRLYYYNWGLYKSFGLNINGGSNCLQ